MKINIYYGGRGILDDPTLFVINKMTEVLTELNVNVERFPLYELRNQITSLPASINEADGIVLATTVEWYGVGGYMMQFLDACWLYGNKEKISKTYMCPVVMSLSSGEREAKTNEVHCIFEDSENYVLAGTAGNGLAEFDNRNPGKPVYTCDYTINDGVTDNNIQQIIGKDFSFVHRHNPSHPLGHAVERIPHGIGRLRAGIVDEVDAIDGFHIFQLVATTIQIGDHIFAQVLLTDIY